MKSNDKSKTVSIARNDAKTENQGIRRRERRNPTETPDWESADAALLRRAVAAVALRNCAIMFGYTRDGATYSIRIVGDGESYNEYVRPPEDIDIYLGGLIEDFESKPPEGAS